MQGFVHTWKSLELRAHSNQNLKRNYNLCLSLHATILKTLNSIKSELKQKLQLFLFIYVKIWNIWTKSSRNFKQQLFCCPFWPSCDLDNRSRSPKLEWHNTQSEVIIMQVLKAFALTAVNTAFFPQPGGQLSTNIYIYIKQGIDLFLNQS